MELPLFLSQKRRIGDGHVSLGACAGVLSLTKAKFRLLLLLFTFFAVETYILFLSGMLTADDYKQLACTSVHW